MNPGRCQARGQPFLASSQKDWDFDLYIWPLIHAIDLFSHTLVPQQMFVEWVDGWTSEQCCWITWISRAFCGITLPLIAERKAITPVCHSISHRLIQCVFSWIRVCSPAHGKDHAKSLSWIQTDSLGILTLPLSCSVILDELLEFF